MGILERREGIGITAPFENVFEKNYTIHELNAKNETRKIFLDELGELFVPKTHFDGQSRTYHSFSKRFNFEFFLGKIDVFLGRKLDSLS